MVDETVIMEFCEDLIIPNLKYARQSLLMVRKILVKYWGGYRGLTVSGSKSKPSFTIAGQRSRLKVLPLCSVVLCLNLNFVHDWQNWLVFFTSPLQSCLVGLTVNSLFIFCIHAWAVDILYRQICHNILIFFPQQPVSLTVYLAITPAQNVARYWAFRRRISFPMPARDRVLTL